MNETRHMSAAMSEITRVAWWSLRAIGCPLGAVERMARVLVHSEVLDGGVLTALRLDERELLEAFASEEPRFVETDAGGGVIEASGRSMLDIGPRAIDLLSGFAKRADGAVSVNVSDTSDFLGLAGCATIAAQRGLGLLIVKADSTRSWSFYACTSAGTVLSIKGKSCNASNAEIINTLSAVCGVKALPLLPDGQMPDASLQLIAFPFVAADNFLAKASCVDNLAVRDVSETLHLAYANGIKVAPLDLQFLYELETRTWAPSSERSRMQAGFGAPVLAA